MGRQLFYNVSYTFPFRFSLDFFVLLVVCVHDLENLFLKF